MELRPPVAPTPRDELEATKGSEKPKRPGKIAKTPNGLVSIKSTPVRTKTGKDGLKKKSRKSTSARVKVGNGGMTRKRKKSSRATVDPSVQVAKECTDKTEQAEEHRAREPKYATPLVEEVTCVTSTIAIGTTARASPTAEMAGQLTLPLQVEGTADRFTKATECIAPVQRKRANRPWEWSAKECRDRLGDPNDCDAQTGFDVGEKGDGGKASEEECTVEEVLVSLDSEETSSERGNTHPLTSDCSNISGGFQRARPRGRSSPPVETNLSRQEEIPYPLRNKNASGKSGIDVPPERVELTVNEAEPNNGRPNRKVSMSTRVNPSQREELQQRASLCCRCDPADVAPVSKSQPEDARERYASQLAEDEKKARELSAELNRNRPRRGGRTGEKHLRCAEDDGDVGDDKEEHIGRGSLRFRKTEDARSPGVMKSGWRKHGTSWFKNVGAAAEVWWGKAWYRCVLYSVAAGGTLGVLEFLPSGNRRVGRMYSMELDLDKWIQDGHLARPKTHLKWD